MSLVLRFLNHQTFHSQQPFVPPECLKNPGFHSTPPLSENKTSISFTNLSCLRLLEPSTFSLESAFDRDKTLSLSTSGVSTNVACVSSSFESCCFFEVTTEVSFPVFQYSICMYLDVQKQPDIVKSEHIFKLTFYDDTYINWDFLYLLLMQALKA